jgi:hypothetical protein
VGGVIGGIGGLVLLSLFGFLLWRRLSHCAQWYNEKFSLEDNTPITQPIPYNYSRDDSRLENQPAIGGNSQFPRGGVGYLLPSKARNEPPMVVSLDDTIGDNNTSSVAPAEVLGLRQAVENLRRLMQSIEPNRIDPPPTYHEDET